MIFKKRFEFFNLTQEDTVFYKGLAILIIMFHNFFHWLPPKIGENEQNFSFGRAERFVLVFYEQPEYIIQTLFSFLGHYGVQIFLFLSAYGLTKKYLHTDPIYFKYLIKRISKIYPAFIFSIIVFFIYRAIMYNGIPNIIDTFNQNWESILYKLTFVANFIPRELYKVNGPWWFVSLIVQFYIFFPFMLMLFKKYGFISLIIISLSSLLITAYFQPHLGIHLAGTVLTHIPELSLGILMAQKDKFSISYAGLIFILIIFILSNIYSFFWYFSFVSITVLLLILFQCINLKSNHFFKENILFIGSISMYIFYINGFMRYPWISNAKHFDTWYGNILISLIFFVLVVSLSYLMMKIGKYISGLSTSKKVQL